METVRFPLIARGAGNVPVKSGDVLGTMGYDPIDPQGLRHLHFEVWYQGDGKSHISPQAPPAPLGGIQNWRVADLQEK